MPRDCIFCGGKPLTKEHIWPKWLRPYIPQALTTHTVMSGLVDSNSRDIEQSVKKWAGDARHRGLRIVCAKCNSGWMSALQESTRDILVPLVSGQPLLLGPQRQARLAAWCAMSAMTSEFFGPERQAISQEDRNYLMEKRRAPSANRWRIWVGRYVRGDWIGDWVHTMLAVTEKEGHPTDDYGVPVPNTQTTTFVVGQLYIHVFSCPLPELVRWTKLTQSLQTMLTQIWPIQRNHIVRWPLDTLTDDDATFVSGAILSAVDRLARLTDLRRQPR